MSKTHEIIRKVLSAGRAMTAQEIRREYLRQQGAEFMEDSGFTARIRELRYKFGLPVVCRRNGKRYEYRMAAEQ